jgi:DNA-directed RNA polymerase specialized sigma24 family protein
VTDPADRRRGRCRPLPPTVVDGRAAVSPEGAEEAELLLRLDAALRDLPDAERIAVIASYAYGEGVVGAAVELDVETVDAAALGERGLALLRTALRDDA